MKKSEIDKILEKRFKKIEKYFHRSIASFETEYIEAFRTEIRKLKVFLHLVNMESDDGLSYRITKRMKTLYGYFGIIRNLQTQFSKMEKHAEDPTQKAPEGYINILEKELLYWKTLILDFQDAGYSFDNDKQEIAATLPDKLKKKSIKKFVNYTLYELNTLSDRTDDDALDSIRKFLEDIYYNYDILGPFFNKQQAKVFDRKAIYECLELFDDFRNRCMSLVLLQTFVNDGLDELEKQSLVTMESECVNEKKDVKNKLIAALDSLNIKSLNLGSFTIASVHNE